MNPIDINADVAQEIPKSLQDQQNFDGSILEVSKDPNTPLTTIYKKVEDDGKPNKKHKRSSKDGSFALALAFFQFVEFSNKIETMKMEMQS